MSLKKLVLTLLVINFAYFAYTQGWWQTLIGSAGAQREPERIAKQINPDAISVKPTSVSSKSNTPPPANLATTAQTCIQDREQWMIYMGPYANAGLSDKKKSELKKIGVTSKDVAKTQLPIGLSLGQFESETTAREELKRLSAKGVRTATVILWEKLSVPCPSGDKP